jgi:ABC-2 type transport system ATP-binding protein
MLLTTHYLDEAEHLADRVGVIAGGRLLDVAPVRDLGGPTRRTPVVRWREGGELREERTADPTATVVALAARIGPVVPDLEVRRPSLEDVYLTMIAEVERLGTAHPAAVS